MREKNNILFYYVQTEVKLDLTKLNFGVLEKIRKEKRMASKIREKNKKEKKNKGEIFSFNIHRHYFTLLLL